MSEPVACRLELQILGPVRLVAAGQVLPLKTRKAYALALLLLMEGGLNRARLCAWLWPGLDESSARRNLRRELARLRAAGAADALVAEGDRLLPAPALGCDLLRAQALLAAGRPDAALALWQGGAADMADGLLAPVAEANEALHQHHRDRDADTDAGFANWLAALRQRADLLRQRALQASAAAAESRGDLGTALKQVQTLLRLDNLHEHQHREAMRLLAATGQREAALRQFEICKNLLLTELGLQPMPQTLAMAQTLLGPGVPATAQSSESSALAATRVPLPGAVAASVDATTSTVRLPPQLPFVGREADVARLQKAWSRGQPVVVAGPAGIGKTRLAADFAAAQGPYALLRCQPGDRELPLSAFARALRLFIGPASGQASSPAGWHGLEPWVATEVTRLLPELGAPPPPMRNANDRLRFDEACLSAWHKLSGENFDAVVLDDWQWADPASHALLAQARGRRQEHGSGTLEILTWRGEPDDPDLQACAEALGAQTLNLLPLPEPAVRELLRQIAGATEPTRFAQRLCNATGGQPFFIAEILRDLAERALLRSDAQGRWQTPFDEQTADYRELPLPASVRDAVQDRVRRLGPAAARLLEAAALAGEPFSAAWLAQTCALSELETLSALDEAARAHLVLARDGGGYGWMHDLARQALDSALSPTRRRLLHHRLALAAEALGARPDAARHFEACGEPASAVRHRLAAGDAALALHALAEAAAQWQQGLADGPGASDEAALVARLCAVRWQRGETAAAQAAFDRLQALLGEPGLGPEVLADLQIRAARYLMDCGRAQPSATLLEAMDPPPSPALRLRWRIAYMGALHLCGRLDEASAEGERALQAAATGSRARAEVLASLSAIEHACGRLGAAITRADAAVAAFTRLGDPIGRARSLHYRGAFAVEAGHLSAGELDLRDAAALAGRHGNVHLQRIALYNLASLHSNLSRPGQALAVVRQAWPAMAGAPRAEVALMFRAMFIECHFQLGDWGALWEHLAPAVQDAVAGAQPLTMLGVANCALEPAAMLGASAYTQPLVQALDANGLLSDVPNAAEIILGCAYSALVQGDLEAAAGWLQRVQQAGVSEHPRVHCRAELLRAELALAAGAGPQALAQLPAADAAGMNPELRLRALVLRWRAGVLARDAGLAALDDPSAHAGVALLLARALGGPAYDAHRARRAESLALWPALQASFLATWR
jgi:DNA-binding SARP family transcriptional activator